MYFGKDGPEKALQDDTGNLYRQIVETTNEGIWIIDTEGKTTYANRRMSEMLGCTLEELVGKNAFDFVFPEDRPEGQRELDRRKSESKGRQVLFRYRKKDGSELWTLVNTSIIKGAEGCVEGVLGMFTDVTELKRAQDELETLNRTLSHHVDERTEELKETTKDLIRIQKELVTSEKKYRSLAENTKDILISMDCEGRITYIGPQIGRYGKIHRDMIGKKLPDILYREDRGTVASELKKVRKSGVVGSFSCRISAANGETHWLEFSGEVQRDGNGRVMGVTGVLGDISERKTTEKALQKSEERRASLAASLTSAEDDEQRRISEVLHDQVSQLLAAIKMKLSLLGMNNNDPEERKLYREIDALLVEALKSVRSLSFELKTSMLLRLGLFEAITELCATMESRYGVHFDFQPEHGELKISRASAVILFKGVRELLFNVVKHADVQQAVVCMKEEVRNLKITVEDRGKGFHVQSDGENLLMEQGLGLASIQERLREIGGKMKIESVPGSHTKVTLWAPNDE